MFITRERLKSQSSGEIIIGSKVESQIHVVK